MFAYKYIKWKKQYNFESAKKKTIPFQKINNYSTVVAELWSAG